MDECPKGLPAHPLERLMKQKLRVATNTYLKFKEEADLDDPEQLAKERLLRGIVRGQAMMLLTFIHPDEHKDKKKIEHIEWMNGFPHPHRLPPPPPKSPTMIAFLTEHGLIE